MFKHDILVAFIDGDGATCYAFFPTNPHGRNALGIGLSSAVKVTYGSKEELQRLSNIANLDIHLFDEPYEVVRLMSRHITLSYEQDALIKDTVEYYMPLFEDAISKRNKKRITELFCEMPGCSVEKAFIIDRLRYGPDRFDELHENGISVYNWNDK